MINNKITLRRVGSNSWVKDLNAINRDKIIGNFKSSDGTLAKTSIGIGVDSRSGLRKVILDKSEEAKFEKEIGLPEGTLASGSEFWKEFAVTIQGNTLELNENDPMDKLRIKLLKSKSIVAGSLAELSTNAYAEFVIVSEVEEAKKANISRDVRKKAYAAFDKMSSQDMEDVLIAMGKKPTSMSKELIEDAIGREIDTNPGRFVLIYTNPKFQSIVFINRLLNMGILVRRGEAISYEEDVLGYDITSAIDFINTPVNKLILDSLTTTYNSKLKNTKK